MRYQELTETTRKLGGFKVKVVAKVPSGAEHNEVDEDTDSSEAVKHAITNRIIRQRPDLLKFGPESVMAAIDDVADWAGDVEEIGSSDVSGWVKQVERMLNENPAEAFVKEERTETKNEKGEVVSWKDETDWKPASKKQGRGKVTNLSDKARRETEKLSGNQKEVDEAFKLDAPRKRWSRDDVQSYADRIKSGTKTKADRFNPIIHGSNIKAITKDDGGEEWDLDDLARQIMTRPSKILGTNAKMAKSKKEGSITYDLTLPAISGMVIDEETGEFVEITTCPGAGECQLICYARKGGYVMFPASSMSAAQALNFLVNDPEGYMKMFDREVKAVKGKADGAGIKLLVRVHDAGDYFSKEYYNLSMDVARNNPDVKFYFYTKMGDVATDTSAPPNVVKQFSSGAQNREVKKVDFVKKAGTHVKDAITLPKDMFRGLFQTNAKGKYVKDDEGRTQVQSPAAWEKFKHELAARYKVDPASIITYDQMVKIPEGPAPKWNVVVFPAGHGDLGAPRLDVANQFLMFH